MAVERIKLFLVHGISLVWNPNDACRLREEHRIVGRMVGCLPRLPRQNTQLGLPLQLMEEEAKLLLEKGVVCLVKDTSPLTLPSEEQISWFENLRKQQHQQQIELYRQERREEMRRHLPKIIEGRKAKKRKLKESDKSSGDDSPHSSTLHSEDETSFDVESVHIPPITMEHTMIQLFTETAWRELPPECVTEWPFPAREQEVLRYRVFRDLWERGYYMTSGCKFGGDFLVYPGDPARFHAFFIAICVPAQSKMAASDIVAMGRLGSNVKKTVLICSLDYKCDTVIYTSLQWTGIG